MVGLPWFLLAAGIAVLILGLFLAAMQRSSGADSRLLDPRMRDDDIARHLKAGEGSLIPGLVIGAGLLVILVSIVWRVVRWLS